MRYVAMLAVVCVACISPEAFGEQPKYFAEDLVVLETIVREDEGVFAVSVLNSRVEIQTSGIEQVAKRGKEVVPSLVRLMETPELTFDTFIRCHAACRKILKQIKPGESLFWQGGAEVEKMSNGVHRFDSNGHEDEAAFRGKVVQDVREKLLNKREAK